MVQSLNFQPFPKLSDQTSLRPKHSRNGKFTWRIALRVNFIDVLSALTWLLSSKVEQMTWFSSNFWNIQFAKFSVRIQLDCSLKKASRTFRPVFAGNFPHLLHTNFKCSKVLRQKVLSQKVRVKLQIEVFKVLETSAPKAHGNCRSTHSTYQHDQLVLSNDFRHNFTQSASLVMHSGPHIDRRQMPIGRRYAQRSNEKLI